jgi:hypothetical protein
MIRTISRLCLAILLAASTAFAASVTGSGRPVTETRAVSGFTGVALAIPGRVEVTQGDQESLTITADDNVLALIQTVVEGGTLKIRWTEKNLSVDRATIRIAVGAKTVERLAVGGSGNLRTGPLRGARLSLSVGGAGDITIASLATGELETNIGGSGNVVIEGGSADSVVASIAGSGDLKAPKLAARRVKVNVAGSGDASVWASESLNVSVAGSGSIRYYGDPKIGKSIVGSGDIRRLGAAPS